LTVDPPTPPTLTLSPSSLAFSATQGGSSRRPDVLVSNTGGGSMDWTASETAAWLKRVAASGSERRDDHGDASITGLAAGTYTTDVT